MTLVIFLIILSVLVVAHELGHLLAAKKSGVRVDEFGLGFPPKIKRFFNWKGTDFILNSLPFGGYVKIFGENPNESIEAQTPRVFGELSFTEVGRGKQIFILLAGVIANILLAWMLLSFVLMLGIESDGVVVQEGFISAIWGALLLTGKITALIFASIWGLISSLFGIGQADLSELVGPVGLFTLVGEVSQMGFAYLLYFTALISLNLAVINLVPIPALDGGRVLLVALEAVRRKAFSPKVFNLLNNMSFLLLILLMLWITVRDIDKLI